MFRKWNLQLFAADTGAGNSGTGAGADGESNAGQKTGGEGDGNQNAGEEKKYSDAELERIATERSRRSETAAVKSYLQQQGLTEDEIKEAISAHKTAKQQKKEEERKNLSALQQQVDDYEKNSAAITAAANARVISAETKVQAIALGIKSDRVDYAVRLADLSKVAVGGDGAVDVDAIKAALEQVVNDLPELKGTVGNEPGFRVGGPGQGTATKQEELNKLFGIKEKKE